MAEEKKGGFMSLIGKIATIAAFMVTIISIIKYINEPKAGLSAQVRFSDFSLPPDLELRHEKLREAMNPQALEKHFIDSIETVTQEDRTTAYLYASSASRLVGDILGEEFRFASPLNSGARGWVRFSINNSGSKTLTGTELRVPNMLTYQIERDGVSNLVVSGEPIKIEDIKPRETISVVGWLSNPLTEHSLNEVSLVHDEGIASIEFFISTSDSSFAAFMGDWGIGICIGLGFCILILMLAISELVAKIRGNAIDAQKNESPPKDTNDNEQPVSGKRQ